jgi:nitrogen regulatory protein PII
MIDMTYLRMIISTIVQNVFDAALPVTTSGNPGDCTIYISMLLKLSLIVL